MFVFNTYTRAQWIINQHKTYMRCELSWNNHKYSLRAKTCVWDIVICLVLNCRYTNGIFTGDSIMNFNDDNQSDQLIECLNVLNLIPPIHTCTYMRRHDINYSQFQRNIIVYIKARLNNLYAFPSTFHQNISISWTCPERFFFRNDAGVDSYSRIYLL